MRTWLSLSSAMTAELHFRKLSTSARTIAVRTGLASNVGRAGLDGR